MYISVHQISVEKWDKFNKNSLRIQLFSDDFNSFIFLKTVRCKQQGQQPDQMHFIESKLFWFEFQLILFLTVYWL